MKKTNQSDTGSDESAKKLKRKSLYATPKLTSYGSVSKLTGGQGGTNFDPGQMNTSKTGNG